MMNSKILNYHKITFIRSKLVPGSRTRFSLQSSTFASSDIVETYDVFKSNFTELFEGEPSIVNQIALVVETLQSLTTASQLWDVMSDADQVAEGFIQSVKYANCTESNQMSVDNKQSFMELFFLHSLYKRRNENYPALCPSSQGRW